jgi:hypothetical protein
MQPLQPHQHHYHHQLCSQITLSFHLDSFFILYIYLNKALMLLSITSFLFKSLMKIQLLLNKYPITLIKYFL